MALKHPRRLIWLGFVLLLLGFVLPVLMVADIITTTLWLSIFSHGASVSGLILGLLGGSMVSRLQQEEETAKDQEKWWE